MADKKTTKVTKFRRPLNVNVGMIVFFIIFIYLVISVIIAATSSDIYYRGRIRQYHRQQLVHRTYFTRRTGCQFSC